MGQRSSIIATIIYVSAAAGDSGSKKGADTPVVAAADEGRAVRLSSNTAQPGGTVILRVCISGDTGAIHASLYLRAGKVARNAAAVSAVASAFDPHIIGAVQDPKATVTSLSVTDDASAVIIAGTVTVGSATGDGQVTVFRVCIRHDAADIYRRHIVVIVQIVSGTDIRQFTVDMAVRDADGAGSRIGIGHQTRQILQTGYRIVRKDDVPDLRTAAYIGKHGRIIPRNRHIGNALVISVKASAKCRRFRADGHPCIGQRNISRHLEMFSIVRIAALDISCQLPQLTFVGNEIWRSLRSAATPGSRRSGHRQRRQQQGDYHPVIKQFFHSRFSFV